MAKWLIQNNNEKPSGGPDGVPIAILNILAERGITGDKVEDFLSPFPKETYDPFLIDNLEEACRKLIDACSSGKRICVYGDYDADGVTSTALLTSVLKKLTSNVRYYVPSRFTDGYGLSNCAIDRLKDDHVDLIITVDCGITSQQEVLYAKELGIDVIITDHHTLGETLPECVCVNPKMSESYPFKELSGCGVAFKMSQGILNILSSNGDERFTKSDLNANLDLVAISTVADVVSLLGENRTLVKYGLAILNRKERRGLRILLAAMDAHDKEVDADSIAYMIAPNINALGRMGSADIGVELLLSEADDVALEEMAYEMVENNKKRKAVQEETRRICERALLSGNSGDYAPVIYAPGAHEGVAGIVAGNFKEDLNKPVCIVTPNEDGLLKGTGRSCEGFNLYDMLAENAESLTRYGGHAGACGFSLEMKNLEAFRNGMQLSAQKILGEREDALEKKIYIEKELSITEKSLEFAHELVKLEPYGEENSRPCFCIRNATVLYTKHLGAERQHVRFEVMGQDGIPVECILFKRAAEFDDILFKGSIVDVAGTVGINDFNGKHFQLNAVDIKGA